VANAVFLNTALAQPTDLSVCLRQCQELLPIHYLICDNSNSVWVNVSGRVWWGPLLCVGPVRISVEAYPFTSGELLLPLFFEARPDDARPQECQPYAGTYLWHTFGGSPNCESESTLVTSPLIDLPTVVGIGNTYYLQIQGFYASNASSPFVRCVRLVAEPTAVSASTWGTMKQLYR
jgi:hypothetical protein